MAALGIHYAITAGEAGRLRSLPDGVSRRAHISGEIEDRYLVGRQEHVAKTGQTWDAMHRCFSDGSLARNAGAYPLNHVVLGGEHLYEGDDFVLCLKAPDQVSDVARALRSLTNADFRRRYFSIDPAAYDFPVDDKDFEFTLAHLGDVRTFYERAAKEKRWVLFTVDGGVARRGPQHLTRAEQVGHWGIDVAFKEAQKCKGDVRKLAKAVRPVYLIASISPVVGGIGGWLRTHDAEWALETVDAHLEVGALESAKALAAALSVFPNGKPPRDIEKREDWLDESDLSEEFWNERDNEYNEAADRDDLLGLIGAYASKHVKAFRLDEMPPVAKKHA